MNLYCASRFHFIILSCESKSARIARDRRGIQYSRITDAISNKTGLRKAGKR